MGTQGFEEGAVREPRPRREPLERGHVQACQSLLDRILELHLSGSSAEEIAAWILTGEAESARFRATMLVEIILQHACPRQDAGEQ